MRPMHYLTAIPKQTLMALALGLGAVVGLAAWAATTPGAEREIAAYKTGLAGRTESQIFNCTLAAKAVNGRVLMPGKTFSFLKAVGAWTADKGYKKAPVSYDGELVRNWGGGVCQLSSTLYNAALLAGLEIVERHRHQWPARYAPVGRDAAVAYEEVDLKFRNNLPAPVRIVCGIEGGSLVCRIVSSHKPDYTAQVETRVLSVIKPSEVVQNRASGSGRWRLLHRGYPGFHVMTYRRINGSGGVRRQLISDDTYPAMNKVVRIID